MSRRLLSTRGALKGPLGRLPSRRRRCPVPHPQPSLSRRPLPVSPPPNPVLPSPQHRRRGRRRRRRRRRVVAATSGGDDRPAGRRTIHPRAVPLHRPRHADVGTHRAEVATAARPDLHRRVVPRPARDELFDFQQRRPAAGPGAVRAEAHLDRRRHRGAAGRSPRGALCRAREARRPVAGRGVRAACFSLSRRLRRSGALSPQLAKKL